MEDVLRVYEQPYDPEEPVVCLDERPVQLLDSKRPLGTLASGRERRQDFEYVRCGTANIFCAVEPLGGCHITKATPNRTGVAFAEMLQDIAARYERAKRIHLVMDNLSTHTKWSVLRRYGEDHGEKIWGRFVVHYTPKHGSWLNQAEIEISILSRQCLAERIATLDLLRGKTTAWNQRANRDGLRDAPDGGSGDRSGPCPSGVAANKA
jgi:transposase